MDQTFDSMFYDQGRSLGGVDEVGVTALAGPIVAACVVLPHLNREDNLDLFLIDDSKKIREHYRAESAKIVKSRALAYGIGVVSPLEIDALNIHVASNLAMRRSVLDCQKRFGNGSVDFCLIDGDRKITLDVPYRLVVKGDMKSLSVASASILAKVHRDEIMKRYHQTHPEYRFKENKGYKSLTHLDGLDLKGLWVGVHRSSMAPLSFRPREPKTLTKRRQGWIKITENKLYQGDTLCGLGLKVKED